jgi:hypothetical protein
MQQRQQQLNQQPPPQNQLRPQESKQQQQEQRRQRVSQQLRLSLQLQIHPRLLPPPLRCPSQRQSSIHFNPSKWFSRQNSNNSSRDWSHCRQCSHCNPSFLPLSMPSNPPLLIPHPCSLPRCRASLLLLPRRT